MNDNRLSQLINQALEEQRVNIDRLASSTNIPKRYLTALKDGDIKNLPPAPYVRGYILKIAEVLNLEAENLIAAYRELTLKRSGPEDSLPVNRFAAEKKSRSRIWIFLIIIFLLLGLWFLRFTPSFRGVPEINIYFPEQSITVVNERLLIIEGRVAEPKDAVFINEEPVLTDYIGRFRKEALLESGLNTFKIRAKRFLGREAEVVRQIFYEERQ